MFEMFPKMTDRPEPKQVALGAGYWFIYVLALPSLISFFFFADGVDYESYVAMCIVYCIINFLLVGALFFRYAADSLFNVRIYPGRFLKAIGIGFAVLVPAQVLMQFCGAGPVDWIFKGTMVCSLPIVDLPYGYAYGFSPLMILSKSPVLASVCLVVMVPVVMGCLYYAVGFAPIAEERPWLGYVVVALIAMIHYLFNSTGAEPLDILMQYLCTLPLHLCACWVYQQTNSIWAPIILHAGINLMSVLEFFSIVEFLH